MLLVSSKPRVSALIQRWTNPSGAGGASSCDGGAHGFLRSCLALVSDSRDGSFVFIFLFFLDLFMFISFFSCFVTDIFCFQFVFVLTQSKH